jgi:hypothetical protein
MKNYNEIAKRVFERRDKYEEAKKIKRQNIMQISTAVVCLVVISVLSFAMVRRSWLKIQFSASTTHYTEDSQTSADSTTKSQSVNHITSPTKNTTSSHNTTTEVFEEIDWNKKSLPGKFPSLAIGNANYLNAIDESDTVGEYVEREYVYPFSPFSETATTREATLLLSNTHISYCEPDGTRHTNVVDVFSLQGFSEDLVLGVRFPDDERIYAYVSSAYIPKTLGEFLTAIDYDNAITYGSITLYPGNNFPVNDKNKGDIKSYLLSDISTTNIMDANAEATGQYVTLSINCHELGRQNKALKIYEDGHITTNLIGYEYTFFVGQEAVADFLKNSYNITFEEIKAIIEVPVTETITTSPTTEPLTSSAATPINETEIYDTTVSDALTTTVADTTEATDPAATTVSIGWSSTAAQ